MEGATGPKKETKTMACPYWVMEEAPCLSIVADERNTGWT